MSELEEKLSQVLSNPEMMQQIMALAGSLGAAQPEPQQVREAPSLPLDPALLGKIAAGTGVDQNQKALLKALGPYLSRERSAKLERAMRAAKMATLASGLLTGR